MHALSPIPSQVNYALGLPDNLGAMLNDELGDCTCAAYYHARQLWTACSEENEITEPDSNVLQMYKEACGYTEVNPLTDQGGVEQDVLSYLLNTGAPVGNGQRDKILAFVEIDPRQIQDIKRAIYECGVSYIGVNLPNSAMSGDIWDIGGDETIAGGHAVILTGYDDNGFNLISWGKKFYMTNAFMQKFLDEAYAIFDQTWITMKGTTPLGLTVSETEAAMQGFRQS